MSIEAILALSMILAIPALGIIGKILNNKLGVKKYRDKVLPKSQNTLYKAFGLRGGTFASALDPQQWQTDKKSLLLIILGIPAGCAILFGFMAIVLKILGYS